MCYVCRCYMACFYCRRSVGDVFLQADNWACSYKGRIQKAPYRLLVDSGNFTGHLAMVFLWSAKHPLSAYDSCVAQHYRCGNRFNRVGMVFRILLHLHHRFDCQILQRKVMKKTVIQKNLRFLFFQKIMIDKNSGEQISSAYNLIIKSYCYERIRKA